MKSGSKKKMKSGTNSRVNAARILAQVLQHKGSLSTAFAERELPADSAGLTRELCYGVMRWYFQLHAVLQLLLQRPVRKKDADVYALLLMGCYQISYMRIPEHAALDETVEACRALNKTWATSLVNAVLREYTRNNDSLLETLNETEQLAHPAWLAKRLKRAWPEQYRTIMAAANARPPMTLRVNTVLCSREVYLQRLLAKGLRANSCKLSPGAITLEEAVDVSQLPNFDEGIVSVQDEGAQLAAPLLQLQAGNKVLDACAAPGGKTCHMLELCPEIQLTSIDDNKSRLMRVDENLERLGLKAHVLHADASKPDTWHSGDLFDAILLDVPCSASGVMRRNPDSKYLRRAKDIEALNQQQITLLDASWPLLKPGGKLLYATCSVLPEENENIVAGFLQTHSDAQALPLGVNWGLEGTQLPGRQLLPDQSAQDGFYYALLHKAPANQS